MPRPTWIVKNGSRKRDHVGITGSDDGLGMGWLGNEPYGHDWNANGSLDGPGKRNLISWSNGNLLIRVQAPGRNMDRVHAACFGHTGKYNRLINGKTAIHPVSRGNSQRDRAVGGKCRADGVKNLQGKPRAVSQRATVLIVAVV